MWYLVSVSNPDVKYVLLVGKEYVVGRKDCEVLIEGDKAVSRKHAVFTVTHTEANLVHPHKLPELRLQDVSKFGTFLNKEAMKGKTVQLKDGDEIFFGSPLSSFIVVHQPFVITSSCLDNESKKLIRTQLLALGGHIVNEWRKDCSLLVMTSISVTIKVICALVSLKSVVLPSYLEQYVKFLKGEISEPNPEKFLPEIAETQLDPSTVTFGKIEGRKNIFRGMKFIFLTPKQFKKMSLAIELAGGTPVLMEEGCDDNDDNDDRVLVEPNTVVINCSLDDNTQNLSQNGRDWVQHVHTYLKKHKKNMIMDAELGYAVLFCSTEKHCNPDINIADQLFNPVPSQTLEAEVLVANTEMSQSRTPRRGRQISGPQVVDETIVKAPSHVAPEMLSQVKIEVFSERTPIKSKRTRDDTEDTRPHQSTSGMKVKKETVSPQKGIFSTDLEETSEDRDTIKTKKSHSSNVTGSVTSVIIEKDQEKGKKRTRPSRSPSPKAPNIKRETDVSPIESVKRNKKMEGGEMSSVSISTERTVEPFSSTFRANTPPPERSLRRSPRTSPVRNLQTPSEKKVFPKSSAIRSQKNVSDDDSETAGSKRKKLESDFSTGFGESGSHRVKTEELNSMKQETEESVQQQPLFDSHDVPTGFLTACQPIEQQTHRNTNYEKEEDLPSRCVEVKFTSLVIRKPKPVSEQQDGVPAGYIRWKGKIVQNFKKFKKTEHAGAGSLPRIIGGSDLEVHAGTRRKELDDWFREAIEAESQQNEVDRRANELFDWQLGGTRTKKSR